jgi:hypothetical protein
VVHPQQEANKSTSRPCQSAFAVLVATCKQVERGPPAVPIISVSGGGAMLDTRFENPPRLERPSHPQVVDDDALPAIVIKAQEDALCRLGLARLGYARVRSEHARQKRAGNVRFESLGAQSLWPTMEFVRDWLKNERKRIIAQARWPFFATMLATIVAGLAFVAVAAILG